MTASKSIILGVNVFHDSISSIDAPEAYACDWRVGKKWTGSAADSCTTPTLTSRPVDCFAIAGHTLSTGGWSAVLKGSDDDFSSDTTIATITPTDNLAKITTFTSVTYAKYRVEISGGSGAWGVGVIAAGVKVELPSWPDRGFDPSPRPMRTRHANTRHATWIGSSTLPSLIQWDWTFAHVSSTFVATAAWLAFERHASYPGGKPFFFCWDPGDHAGEVKLCVLREGISKKRGAGMRVPELELKMFAMQEDDS